MTRATVVGKLGVIFADGGSIIGFHARLMSIGEVRKGKGVYHMRKQVEGCLNRLKQYRRIATRYEKMDENYLAMMTLASLIMWL